MVLLAAKGELSTALLGQQLATLTGEGVVVLGRAVDSLGEAARAGAHGGVWNVISEMLPTLLRLPKPRAGTADLLALAANAADTSRTTGTTAPGVDSQLRVVLSEVAARPGGSRLVTESKRLARVLTL
jgi:hypothetical protein